MKVDQVIFFLIFAGLLYFLLRKFFDVYDEVEFTYDPSTGRQA